MSSEYSEGAPSACHDPYLRCAFFGAAQTVTGIRRACVLSHSPQGCDQLVNTAFGWQQTDYLATKSLCSKLCEDEIVHGGEATLAKVIEDARAFSVSAVFVLTACGPEMVGDDIVAVCQEMAADVPFQLVPIECAGFRGTQYDGIDIALHGLLNQLVENPGEPMDKIPDSVILIAPHASANPSWPGDLSWVEDILERFGLTVLASLTHGTGLEQLRDIGRAQYSLMLTHDCGYRTETLLADRWDIRPLLPTSALNRSQRLPLPVGFSNTGRWLQRLGQVLDKEDLAQKMVVQGEQFAVEQLRRQGLPYEFFNGAQVAILADATLAVPLLGMLAEDLECEPVAVGIRSRAPELHALVRDECDRVAISPRIETGVGVYETAQILSAAKPDVIIGSNIERHLAEDLGIPYVLRVVNPVARFRLTNREYFGYHGFLNLMEIMQNDWWDTFRSKKRHNRAHWLDGRGEGVEP